MTTVERVQSVLTHLNPISSPRDKLIQKNPDDVVITLALRTPLCKYKNGALSQTTLDTITLKILEQVKAKCNLDPALVDDVCLGNVRDGDAATYCRAAVLAAGFPNTTAACSSSRMCSSGLTATAHIANEVATGLIDIGIAIGAEMLSQGNDRVSQGFDEPIMSSNQEARDCLLTMGQTSENVAKQFDVTREEQDRYGVESYRRAEAADKAGWFKDELVPITVKKDGQEITITKDEIRYGTTYEKVAKLPPAFAKDGRSTAGNSSQITDGAAAVLMMKRSKALELGQPILAKYVGCAIAGLEPRIMGIGPTIAIPKLLARYNLDLDRDIDVVEINEAFASMAVYCRDTLKLDWTKMNPRGGAIALGHPFGMTGVRQIVCGLSECRRTQKKVLLTSMCLGTGMGMAGLFVNEQ